VEDYEENMSAKAQETKKGRLTDTLVPSNACFVPIPLRHCTARQSIDGISSSNSNSNLRKPTALRLSEESYSPQTWMKVCGAPRRTPSRPQSLRKGHKLSWLSAGQCAALQESNARDRTDFRKRSSCHRYERIMHSLRKCGGMSSGEAVRNSRGRGRTVPTETTSGRS
jgi:hypothetical protein